MRSRAILLLLIWKYVIEHKGRTKTTICLLQVGAADYIALAQNYHTVFITDIPIMSMRIHDKVRDCWVILSTFIRACPLISSVTGIIFLLQLLVSIGPVNWLLCPQSKSVTIWTRCVFFFCRHLWRFQDVEVAWLGMVTTFPLGSPLGCKFSIFVRGIVSSCGRFRKHLVQRIFKGVPKRRFWDHILHRGQVCIEHPLRNQVGRLIHLG